MPGKILNLITILFVKRDSGIKKIINWFNSKKLTLQFRFNSDKILIEFYSYVYSFKLNKMFFDWIALTKIFLCDF